LHIHSNANEVQQSFTLKLEIKNDCLSSKSIYYSMGESVALARSVATTQKNKHRQ